MNNTKRGFRVVVFDVFGTCISRPKLEEASSTRKAAEAKADAEQIDLIGHYRTAIQTRQDAARRQIDEGNKALDELARAISDKDTTTTTQTP